MPTRRSTFPSARLIRQAGLRVLLTSMLALAGRAAEFHTPISITSPNSTAYYPLEGLRQGPGAGYQAVPPHDGITGTGQTWVTSQPNGGSQGYYANGVPAPILVIDLGANRWLTEISTWGYAEGNANGVRTFDLRFATEAEGPAGFGLSIPAQAGFTANQSPVVRHGHPLVPVSARYVEFTATGNYRGVAGAGPGGDRVGLGEIAFANTGPGTDPWLDTLAAIELDFTEDLDGFELEILNGGATQNLAFHAASFTGGDAAAFAVLAVPATIAPGAAASLLFSLNPAGISGTLATTLVLQTNDPLTPVRQIPVGGFFHDPQLAANRSLDFGIVPPGVPPRTSLLRLANSGRIHPLNISQAALVGADAAAFSLEFAPLAVPPGGAAEIPLAFDPAGVAGALKAAVTFASNDPANPLVTINLTARVVDFDHSPVVRINEFMASNTSGLRDGHGNRPDWIELHNAGTTAVDLAGWHLTDNAGDLTKWQFPQLLLEAGAYLVVFASGNDQPDPAGNLHTNFALAAAGEYLALVEPDGFTIASEFHPGFPPQFADISWGWRQSISATANAITAAAPVMTAPQDGSHGLTWTQRTFVPDAGWLTGTGQGVGYDNNPDYLPLVTSDVKGILYTPRRPGLYIRYPFSVTDAAAVTAIKLRMRWDDGFVAYLNGVEIARRNASASPQWDSLAAANASPEPSDETIDVSAHAAELQNGANVLAVHGMNVTTGSSDFLILPELQITSSQADLIDATGYLAVATPGAANSTIVDPGPVITAVTPAPAQPLAGQATTITACIAPQLAPVAAVTLHYRVGYGTVQSVTMTDDGTGADSVAGDAVFAAFIPAGVHTAGDMLRWAVTATDDGANTARAPAFLASSGERQSPEYFGTVIPGLTPASTLPHFQWFTPDAGASHTRAGARASVHFAGRFYDNVFVRQRGGATNGSVSQKFDFNKGEEFFIDDSMPKLTEINLNGNGWDATYARQPLAFQAYQIGGSAACNSALWEMQVNKSYDRVAVFIEQVDEQFLTRNGLDPDGDLYKMTSRADLLPGLGGAGSGFEKKSGATSDPSSMIAFIDGLNQPSADDCRAFVIDQLDLPQVLNYLALRSITMEADDVRKNFYLYQDSRGDRRWRIFPWDKDWTFGVTGDGGTWLPHPFFAASDYAKQNANQWNRLYDIIFDETTTSRLYLRRLRTLMDTLLQPASTPAAERILETRAAAIIAPASPRLPTDLAAIHSFLASRRGALSNNYPALIPAAQPANPSIAITGADVNPASGNQDEEYVVLHNNEDTEIDLSGWSLDGAARFTFAPGTVIERAGDLHVCANTLAFRRRATSPTGNEDRLAVGPYSGRLSNFGDTIDLRDTAGSLVSTHTTPVQPTDAQLHLVVSELLYHPAGDGVAEFIEVMNTSADVTLDLGGVAFVEGISFTFPGGFLLAPGGRAVVVRDPAAFAAVYGAQAPVAGSYAGSALSNGGEEVKLEDAAGGTIARFTYGVAAPWPAAGDGAGGIVLIAPHTRPDPADPASWRLSMEPVGTPGGTDAIRFTGDPAGDADGNGQLDLIDYALGPRSAVSGRWDDGGFILTFARVPNADDAIIIGAEYSLDLSQWLPAETMTVARDSATFRLPQQHATARCAFMRVNVGLR